MFGVREISYRQLSLFGLVVFIGLFLTGFIVSEVYQNSINEARSRFRGDSARFLARVGTDLANINSSVTRFSDVFALTGEPEGRSLADYVDSYTSINPSETATSVLIVSAETPEKRAEVEALVRQLNGDVIGPPEVNASEQTSAVGYILTYIGAREREVSDDGGASLLGLDLAQFEGYRDFFDTIIAVRQTEFALINQRLSPEATDTPKLVIASPFQAEVGPAYLAEVVHLDVLANLYGGMSRLIGDIEFTNVRPGRTGGENSRVRVSVGQKPIPSVVPSGGAWMTETDVNIGLGGLRVKVFASADAYIINYQNVLRAAVIGFLITSVLGFLAYDQIRRSNRVVEIVKRRTRALKEAHSELETHYKLLQNLNSDVEQARKAAEAANMAKSEFLATMSHELRTPLNAILGFSEILETETLGPIGDKRYADYARDINSSGKHLLSIINDILDLAKLEAGRVTIERKPFEPRDLVERTMGLLGHQAEEKQLEFTFDVADDLPQFIQGDELRLRQVLINLVSNAVKFTTKGSVNIRMHPRPFKNGAPGWVLEVQDTGIGIPEDKQSLLFDRFTQLDTTHSRRHGGVGLGLAICRELVDRMDGMISVRSIQGVGTTIRVQLPLDVARPEEDDGSMI